MQLQRALHDPIRGISLLCSETIANFLKKTKIYRLNILTTNARFALVQPHTLRSHVGKLMRDAGGSTDLVFTSVEKDLSKVVVC